MDSRRGYRSILSNYRIDKTLGHGAFGKVKLAVHNLTGIKVAIKILSHQSLDETEAKKVRREINIMRHLSHPHVVRLFEVIETTSKIYMVMEYVNSGELFDYLTEKGRLDEDEARYFFQQIISGLEYCHSHMVAHRDLKPENILLDSKHNLKVADFGLGNFMRDGHFLKTYCGSTHYAAPELIAHRLYAGPEADIWSCGVILYAFLCGRLPFDDDNILALHSKIMNGIYPVSSNISSCANDLIARILVIDPVRRITIPEIHQHPWFQQQLPQYISSLAINILYGTEKEDRDHREIYVRSVAPVQEKWTLGFKSQASPHQTMTDVLQVFHSLNVQWKQIGHYKMKCLWERPHSKYSRGIFVDGCPQTISDGDKILPSTSGTGMTIGTHDSIKFEVQLYKASDEMYVVDLQWLNGPPFLFLEICASFLSVVGII